MILMAKTADQLAANLAFLMSLFDYKPAKLAKLSGVSPRMIAYILSGERVPTVDTAEQLARPFGLNGWQLLIPTLPDDIEQLKTIGTIVSNYVDASNEGKSLISMIAERESAHKAANNH